MLNDAQALLFWQQYDYWLNVEGSTEEKSQEYAWEDVRREYPNSPKHLMMTRWRRYNDEASQQIHSRISTTKRGTSMESKCWMCTCELDEDEVQYCAHCELQMMAEINGEENENARVEALEEEEQ